MRPPALTHPRAAVFLGDCLDVLAEMPDNSVDAIVTDPPYGLGFMGKAWDDLPPGLPWAQECLRVLKPGGHLLAFGGTRTWHRLAVAVEDAGFEVRDSIAWLYGSGFPKSLDVSKAIDKRPGVQLHAEFARHLAERREASRMSRADVSERVVGTRSGAVWNWEHHQFPEAKWWPALRDLLGMDEAKWGPVIAEAERRKVGEVTHARSGGDDWAKRPGSTPTPRTVDVTESATPAAQQWSGWGTALKPAFEPIVVARKPLVGTVAANVLAHGVGALNIDGTRVGAQTRTNSSKPRADRNGFIDGFVTGTETTTHDHGRWPTNVLLDDHAAAELDDAARFFPTFRYQAKAPTRERPTVIAEDGTKTAHPTVKPLALMRWLVRLVTPAGGTVLDTFAGSGATIEAAVEEGFYALGIEREETYLPLIQVRLDRVETPDEDEEGAA